MSCMLSVVPANCLDSVPAARGHRLAAAPEDPSCPFCRSTQTKRLVQVTFVGADLRTQHADSLGLLGFPLIEPFAGLLEFTEERVSQGEVGVDGMELGIERKNPLHHLDSTPGIIVSRGMRIALAEEVQELLVVGVASQRRLEDRYRLGTATRAVEPVA